MGWEPAGFRRDPGGRTNAVYVCEELDVVACVARTSEGPASVGRRLALAGALAARTPFVQPLGGVSQPVGTDHGVVSVWRYVRGGGTLDWAALGDGLRRLHSIEGTRLCAEAGTGALPARRLASDDGRIERLAEAGRLRPGDATCLSAQREAMLGTLRPVLADSGRVLHGDLHRGNIISAPGAPVLCDTDELSVGDPLLDLCYLFDPGRPPAGPEDRRAFEDGYGTPLPDLATVRTVARWRHLSFTLRLVESARGQRDRFWVEQWLTTWRRVGRDPSAEVRPPAGQHRVAQLRAAVEGVRSSRGAGRGGLPTPR